MHKGAKIISLPGILHKVGIKVLGEEEAEELICIVGAYMYSVMN